MSSSASQSRYQVRFEQGAAGLARIADGVDIVVWAEPLAGDETAAAAALAAVEAAPVGAEASVVVSGFVDATATARWILAEQERLGRRAYLAIVAADRGEGFDAIDLLAAGAVIDALTTLGIDDTSPEAAVVCASFAGLRRAVRHLTAASAAGRAAAESSRTHEQVLAAAQLDASDAARVVRAGASV
ncbi:hypothetical protein FLP10_12330 [Agromyces intestinalis]|uniref:2-phosphosulfolactate phosphatase n=1 Tax=Agromyces intestinalis TaxID=2592652 RepID=A0A5C1YIB4_9MICO|nr:hypothetical protein [Agromyces intestinalis]QEO15110.1 hypothetical protein FLP10_12330 [Agromyces intestinalis]